MCLFCSFTDFFSWPGWVGIAAIGTLAAAFVAARYTYLTRGILVSTRESIERQNTSIERQRKVAEFEIYMRIADSLDAGKAQKLIDACCDNTLVIDSENPNEHLTLMVAISGGKFERLVLNPLEDLAKFYEDGLISIDSVDSGFRYVILSVGNNEHVKTYLKLQKIKYPNSFKGFKKLYSEIYLKVLPEEQENYTPTIL
jgi:hypothetical protein